MPIVIGVCWLLQIVWAQAVDSPWLVPDALTAALVLLVSRSPEQWLGISIGFGGLVMVGAVRVPVAAGVGVVVIGWVVQRAARWWQVTDPWLQALLAATSSAVIACGLLGAAHHLTAPLLGRALLRGALTGAVVWGVLHVVFRAQLMTRRSLGRVRHP